VTSYRVIFGNWDPKAPSLADYLAEMGWYLDSFMDVPGGAKLLGPPIKVRVKANWKLFAENFIGDWYHVGWTHTAGSLAVGGDADCRLEIGAFDIHGQRTRMDVRIDDEADTRLGGDRRKELGRLDRVGGHPELPVLEACLEECRRCRDASTRDQNDAGEAGAEDSAGDHASPFHD
jgi:hypothetical protein